MSPADRLAQIDADLDALSAYPPTMRFSAKERYAQGWSDLRALFAAQLDPEPAHMTLAHCSHCQRCTPHADGRCIYHKNGECA